MIIDGGVVVGSWALVVLVWNLGRMNNIMKKVSDNRVASELNTFNSWRSW